LSISFEKNKMRKMILKNKKSNSGFMMIEAVFSIFIVGAVLVTFLAVMGNVYTQEFGKRDYVIATNLAQEGIEIMRNIRDNNWKSGKDAFTNPPFPANVSGGTNYCVDYNDNYSNNAPTICADTTTKLKNNNGFYRYSASGTNTKFSRYVRISGSGDKRIITSIVIWRPSGATGDTSITMTDTLYAWGDP